MACEIVLLEQNDAQAVAGRIARDRAAVDAAADDRKFIDHRAVVAIRFSIGNRGRMFARCTQMLVLTRENVIFYNK